MACDIAIVDGRFCDTVDDLESALGVDAIPDQLVDELDPADCLCCVDIPATAAAAGFACSYDSESDTYFLGGSRIGCVCTDELYARLSRVAADLGISGPAELLQSLLDSLGRAIDCPDSAEFDAFSVIFASLSHVSEPPENAHPIKGVAYIGERQ